jgi:hypothetical protein
MGGGSGVGELRRPSKSRVEARPAISSPVPSRWDSRSAACSRPACRRSWCSGRRAPASRPRPGSPTDSPRRSAPRTSRSLHTTSAHSPWGPIRNRGRRRSPDRSSGPCKGSSLPATAPILPDGIRCVGQDGSRLTTGIRSGTPVYVLIPNFPSPGHRRDAGRLPR